MMYAPTKPYFEVGKPALHMVQNRILEVKIRKLFYREQMMEDNL